MLPLVVLAVSLTGFHASPRLAPAASFAAQKPVTVWCANDGYAWAQFVGHYDVLENGRAVPGSNEMWLSGDVCGYLTKRLAKKPVPLFSIAASMLVLTHESFHLRGLTDEGQTDCQAARYVPNVASRFFGYTTHKQRHGVAGQVAAYRGHETAPYRTIC